MSKKRISLFIINILSPIIIFFVSGELEFLSLIIIYPTYIYIEYKNRINKRLKIKKIVKTELADVLMEYLIYKEAQISTYNCLKYIAENKNSSVICNDIKALCNMIKTGKDTRNTLLLLAQKYEIRNLDTFIRLLYQEFEKGDVDINNYKNLLENIYSQQLMNINIKGQEAQTKLIFPMTIIFIDVIIVSVYPALCQIKF